MDDLEEVLDSLVEEVPGAIMAGLLGLDGVGAHIAFSEAWRDSEEELIEVELATLANAVQEAARRLHDESSSEFFLQTAQASFLGMMLGSSYFLVLGLEPGGTLEPGRDALAQALETLAA